MTQLIHYLSGPMTGIPEFNYPLFAKVAANLRAQGLEVLSPHEIDGGQQVTEETAKPWQYYMTHALRLQLHSEAWVGLPGWWKSKGAKREFDIAVDLQHKLYLAKPIHQQNTGFWKLEELA